jgi:hypothetical protein
MSSISTKHDYLQKNVPIEDAALGVQFIAPELERIQQYPDIFPVIQTLCASVQNLQN